MYESFYGLTKRPFALIPDSSFLFLSGTHKKAISYLVFGLSQQEGFIVITGDVGTGKTLTIQSIMDYLEKNNLHGMRIAAANVTAQDVLPLVASIFGISPEITGKASLLSEIEKTLHREYKDGVLLIVDEAQTFTAEALEELRILSNLSIEGRALLQVALVGQTDLRQVLNVPNMKQFLQRVIAWHELEPLRVDETREYVQHRLKTAGWTGNPSFDPDLFSMIQEWSHGIPRRINILMDRFLLYGYLEEKSILTTRDLEEVISEMGEEFSPPPSPGFTPDLDSSSQQNDASEAKDSKFLMNTGYENRSEINKQSLPNGIDLKGRGSEQEIDHKNDIAVNNKLLLPLIERLERLVDLLEKENGLFQKKNTRRKLRGKSRRLVRRPGDRPG